MIMYAFTNFLLCLIVLMVKADEVHKWAEDYTLTSIPDEARVTIRQKWNKECYHKERTKWSECVLINSLLHYNKFDELLKVEEYHEKYKNSFQVLWNTKLRGILNSWFSGEATFPKMGDDPEEYFFLFKEIAPLELRLQYKLQFSRLTMYSKYLEKEVLENKQSIFMRLSEYVDIFIDKLDSITPGGCDDSGTWRLHKLEFDDKEWREWEEINYDKVIEKKPTKMWKYQIDGIRKHYCGKNSPKYKEKILKLLEELQLITNGITNMNRKRMVLKSFELYNKMIGMLIQEVVLENLSQQKDWESYNRRKKEEYVIRRVICEGQVKVLGEWHPSLMEKLESSFFGSNTQSSSSHISASSHQMASSSSISSRVSTSNPSSQHAGSPARGSQRIRSSSSSSLIHPSSSQSNHNAFPPSRSLHIGSSSSSSSRVPPSFPTSQPSSSFNSLHIGSSSSSSHIYPSSSQSNHIASSSTSGQIPPSFPTSQRNAFPPSRSPHIGSSSSSSSRVPPSFQTSQPSSSSKSPHIGASTSTSNKNWQSSPSKFHDNDYPSSSSSRIPSSNPITTSPSTSHHITPSTSFRQPSQSGKLPQSSSESKSLFPSSSRQ